MLKLKELRQEKGLSQEQLAAIINVKNYTIGKRARLTASAGSNPVLSAKKALKT